MSLKTSRMATGLSLLLLLAGVGMIRPALAEGPRYLPKDYFFPRGLGQKRVMQLTIQQRGAIGSLPIATTSVMTTSTEVIAWEPNKAVLLIDGHATRSIDVRKDGSIKGIDGGVTTTEAFKPKAPGAKGGGVYLVGPETVTLAGHTFRALKLEFENAPGTHPIVGHIWVAPGVGIIRQESTGSVTYHVPDPSTASTLSTTVETTIVTELTEFRP